MARRKGDVKNVGSSARRQTGRLHKVPGESGGILGNIQ